MNLSKGKTRVFIPYRIILLKTTFKKEKKGITFKKNYTAYSKLNVRN